MRGFSINIPPKKIQGIKTKLPPLIEERCPSSTSERWIGPFMGSCIAGLNLAGKQAVFADLNPYVDTLWSNCHMVHQDHFCHTGAKGQNRFPMVQALLTNYPLESPAAVNLGGTSKAA